jgi:threonine efflux protein
MTASAFLSANVLLAYTAYFIGTASPGPSNLAIMSLAMGSGRKAAFAFALGVMSGSFSWAMLATLGLSAVLATYSQLLVAIRVVGGLYLLWLAWKSARSALTPQMPLARTTRAPASSQRLYVRGLLLHLTNPKAILVWLSIVSLAVPAALRTPHRSCSAAWASACSSSAATPCCSRPKPRAASMARSGAGWTARLPSCSAWPA